MQTNINSKSLYLRGGNEETNKNTDKQGSIIILLLIVGVFLGLVGYNSYYKDSEIDRFLNGEYYSTLKEIHHLIKNTPIEIYSKDSIGFSGDETEYINRHIYLLSMKELGYEYENEGKKLDYFNKVENWISYYNGEATSWGRQGEATSWLLRTPVGAYFSAVFSVAYDGAPSIGNAFSLYGVRPAFCVDSSAKIKKKEGIIDGEKVYVLE